MQRYRRVLWKRESVKIMAGSFMVILFPLLIQKVWARTDFFIQRKWQVSFFLSLTGFFNSSLACFTRYLPRSHYLKVGIDHVKDHSLCKTSPHSSLKQWLSYLNRVSEQKSSSLEGFDLSSNRKSKVRNQVETRVGNHSPGQTSLNSSHGKRKCFWLSQQNLLETRDIFKTFRYMFIATPQYAGRWVFEQSCHSMNYFHVLKLRYGDQQNFLDSAIKMLTVF